MSDWNSMTPPLIQNTVKWFINSFFRSEKFCQIADCAAAANSTRQRRLAAAGHRGDTTTEKRVMNVSVMMFCGQCSGMTSCMPVRPCVPSHPNEMDDCQGRNQRIRGNIYVFELQKRQRVDNPSSSYSDDWWCRSLPENFGFLGSMYVSYM